MRRIATVALTALLMTAATACSCDNGEPDPVPRATVHPTKTPTRTPTPTSPPPGTPTPTATDPEPTAPVSPDAQ